MRMRRRNLVLVLVHGLVVQGADCEGGKTVELFSRRRRWLFFCLRDLETKLVRVPKSLKAGHFCWEKGKKQSRQIFAQGNCTRRSFAESN